MVGILVGAVVGILVGAVVGILVGIEDASPLSSCWLMIGEDNPVTSESTVATATSSPIVGVLTGSIGAGVLDLSCTPTFISTLATPPSGTSRLRPRIKWRWRWRAPTSRISIDRSEYDRVQRSEDVRSSFLASSSSDLLKMLTLHPGGLKPWESEWRLEKRPPVRCRDARRLVFFFIIAVHTLRTHHLLVSCTDERRLQRAYPLRGTPRFSVLSADPGLTFPFRFPACLWRDHLHRDRIVHRLEAGLRNTRRDHS